MEISLGALRRLRLSPNALATALYLLDRMDSSSRVHARTQEIVDEVGISRPTAQRAITELITVGFMTRIVRGVYTVAVSELCSPVSEERSPVSESEYVRTTSSTSKTETANAVSDAPRASTPKGITMITYDEPDGLGSVGRLEVKPVESQQTKPKGRKAVPDLHRAVPREEWTMDFVTKEFKHRMYLWLRASGKSVMGDDIKSLSVGLRRWRTEFGLTVQEAAELCDRFWDSSEETSRIGNEVPAAKRFLQFVKMNLDGIRANVITDEHRESVMNQELL